LNMLVNMNCYECQGVGGLYDHGLGIDDECENCGGTGAKMYASGDHLEEHPKCNAAPQWLEKKVKELWKEVEENGGTANYILDWERAQCPCCEDWLKFELGDDGLTTDVRCSEEGVCHFEILLWPSLQ